MDAAAGKSSQDTNDVAWACTKAEKQARALLVDCINRLLRLEAYAPTVDDCKKLDDLDEDNRNNLVDDMLKNEQKIFESMMALAQFCQKLNNNEAALEDIRNMRSLERIELANSGHPLIPVEVGDGTDKRSIAELQMLDEELDKITSYKRLEELYKRQETVSEHAWAEERSKKAPSGDGKKRARKDVKRLQKDLDALKKEKEDLRDKIKAHFSVLTVDPVSEEERRRILEEEESASPKSNAEAEAKTGGKEINSKRRAERSVSVSPELQDGDTSSINKKPKFKRST